MNSGWLVLNKEPGITSSQATRRVGRAFGLKAGHGGTLDPFARGVLPIGLGHAACKCLGHILESDKAYLFTIVWGMDTDTLDITGTPRTYRGQVPKEEEIRRILPAFVGEIQQVPPAFSAIKKDGIPYHKRARAGEECLIPSRKVRVYSLKLVAHHGDTSEFEVSCAKGFYVRALARDLGNRLQTFGCVSKLNRLKAGPFDLKDSFLMRDLSGSTPLLPLDYPFRRMKKIMVNEEQAQKLKNGVSIIYGGDEGSFVVYSGNSMIGFGTRKDGRVFPKRILSR